MERRQTTIRLPDGQADTVNGVSDRQSDRQDNLN